MEKQKIIFDVDPGVDDCMALIMAFYEPSIDVQLVTTTFGNVSNAQTTKNACFIVQNFADKDYPVYQGADRGLNTPVHDAAEVHGRTGLGNKIVAENVTKTVANKPGYGAVEAMRDTILKNPGEITLVAVGPVTNVANLFTKYPETIEKIKRVVLMVGSIDGKGSITPYASFNAYCDPDAVQVVIDQAKKVPITVSTKENGTTCYFEDDQRERFAKCGRLGPLFYDLCDGYVDKILLPGQYALHDTCALFTILEDEEFFTREKVSMKINTTFDEKRAQTKFRKCASSNITLITGVDKQRVIKRIEKILKRT